MGLLLVVEFHQLLLMELVASLVTYRMAFILKVASNFVLEFVLEQRIVVVTKVVD